MLSLPIDEQLDGFLSTQLVQYYGDLLKVSRVRGVNMTLPNLRKYVASNDYILESYDTSILSEIEGQGLAENAVVLSLQAAQMVALSSGDHKNNTIFSTELKKIIQEGKSELDSNGAIVAVSAISGKVCMADAIIKDPLNVDLSELSNEDCTKAREILLGSFEVFSKWAFEIQMGFKFQMQDFHSIIFQVCQDIIEGKRDRVIVNIPPRHSKTQILSIFLPLVSFCHNPSSHNIITSYADDVVGESSGYIRTIITNELFGRVFPYVKIDSSKRSLERWGTSKGGVLHAVPSGGKLTGKGAGSLSTKYSGVLVLDDIIKPKDAYSNAVRTEINDRYDNTLMSRLANDGEVQDEEGNRIKCARTPVAIIMQRVHDEDLVGYLLRGKSSDKYDWLNIPAIIEGDTGSAEWYEKRMAKQGYTHATPITYDLKRKEPQSALWASRKSLESLIKMKATQPYTYFSQYDGDPAAKGTGLLQDEWWQEYSEIDKSEVQRTFMTCDTASTVQTYSDFSVICHWAEMRNHDVYLLDLELGKFETPELKKMLIDFWEARSILDVNFPTLLPTALHMEDKSSGQFLNQQFSRDGNIRLMPVPKDKSSGDKVARFLNTIPYFAQMRIFFPKDHKHLPHFKRELLGMTGMGSSTGHDDCVDCVSDMVAIVYSGPSANYEAWM